MVRVCRANCLIYWANSCQLNDAPVSCEWNITKKDLRLGSALSKRINEVSWKSSSSDVQASPHATALLHFRHSSLTLSHFYFTLFFWIHFILKFIHLNPLFFLFSTEMFNWHKGCVCCQDKVSLVNGHMVEAACVQDPGLPAGLLVNSHLHTRTHSVVFSDSRALLPASASHTCSPLWVSPGSHSQTRWQSRLA